jgi:hypothetical protein
MMTFAGTVQSGMVFSAHSSKTFLIFDCLFYLMSVRTKKFLCWLWIGALLTATVGISVHRLYCYCVGQETVSLFARTADDHCTEQLALKRHSCCMENDQAAGFHKKCADESIEVFQLKEEYLTEYPTVKTFDCPSWLAELPMFKRFFRPAICGLERPLPEPPGSPPPLTGRELCQRYQIFRI